VGHGKHTDYFGNISLPPTLRLQENTVQALIHHIYPGLPQLQPPFHQYFCKRIILSSRNDDVDDLNNLILDSFPGEDRIFFANDSVANDRPEDGELMYPAEYLNNINCSGLPLAKLQLKIGCPVMVLRNLYPSEGVCNGTRGVVKRMSTRVVEIELLSEDYRGKWVFIPRIKHTPAESQIPFKLEQFQFPLKVCFAMTINKSQGQSVTYVGLDLKSPVFTHGQFYVGISRVRSVNNIKAIWDENLGDGVTKNVVYPEVLLN
jgi:ATP-dependent exoDNAse (exonuclease V) alpha subunit